MNNNLAFEETGGERNSFLDYAVSEGLGKGLKKQYEKLRMGHGKRRIIR